MGVWCHGQLAYGATDGNWLAAQAGSDGAVATPSDGVTPFQATVEALRAFSVLGESGRPIIPSALQFVNGTSFSSTVYLSDKIVTNSLYDGEVGPLVDELIARQNHDGGFGDKAGYDSTAIDTAIALEALAVAGRADAPALKTSVAFLISFQNADGGWADGINASSSYITAVTVSALRYYRNYAGTGSAIDNAKAFLLSRRDANGQWAWHFETALALIALIRTPADAEQLSDSIAGLSAARRPDGSWDGDTYTTAVVLRSLQLAESPPSLKQLSSIRGRVIDGDAGYPLDGVAVSISGPSNSALSTKSDGTFLFRQLPAGNYSLQVTSDGYSAVNSTTVTEAGQTTDLGTIQLLKQSGSSTGTILGTITDTATGLPLTGVAVTVPGTESAALTGASGSYLISNVSPGAITVTAAKTGYSTASVAIEIVAGGTFVFSSALTPVAARTTAIQGTVTDAQSGHPVSGVTISLSGTTTANAVTDAQGSYGISDLTAGDITVNVTAVGYNSVSVPVTVVDGSVLIFSPKLYPPGANPSGANGAGVNGVVVDAATGKPLAGAGVSATFGAVAKTTVTGATGRFSFSGVTELQGVVRITLTGYADRTFGLVLTPLTLLDMGRIRLHPVDVTKLLPDLIVNNVDKSAVTNDPATLAVSGSITAAIGNQGTAAAPSNIDVLVFYDANKDGAYDTGVDTLLGKATTADAIGVNDSESVAVTLSGVLPYRDAPISVLADGAMVVPESDETNNTRRAGSICVVPGPAPPGIIPAPGYEVEIFAADVTTQQGPAGLAIDSQGDIYFTGGDYGAAFKFTPDSNISTPFGSANLTDTDGIAIDNQDNVIVSGNPETKFSPDGSVIWQFSCAVGNVQSVGVDEDGFVYVGSLSPPSRNSMCRIAPDGISAVFFTGFNQPTASVVDSHGMLYVSQLGADNIVRVDKDTGEVLGIVAQDIFATQLAFDNQGILLAGDYNTGAVLKIDPATGAKTTIASGFPSPQAIAVTADGKGNIYVADRTSKTIYKISNERIPGPDLTAARLSVKDNGIGQPFSFSLRVGNSGGSTTPDGVPVSFYEGNPAAGGKLLGTMLMDALAPGTWRDVQLDDVTNYAGSADVYAVVDADNGIFECDEDNNVVSVSVPASTRGSITVSTDTVAYGSDENVLVQGIIRNLGLLPGTFHAELRIDDITGALVADLSSMGADDLKSGDSSTVSGAWNTGATLSGTYLLHGILRAGDGTVLDESTATFKIRHSTPDDKKVSLRTTVDKAVYHTNDTVRLMALVRNTTRNVLIDAAALHVGITDDEGNEVFSRNVALHQIVPDARSESLLDFALNGVVTGRYTVSGTVADSNDQVLAASEADFTVENKLAESVTGQVSLQNPRPYQGETQVCMDSLTNAGIVPVINQAFRLLFVNIDTGQTFTANTYYLGLGVGVTRDLVQSVQTAGMPVGAYACVLQTDIAGDWKTIGYADFQLQPPPVRIDADLKLGARGRLLVLMGGDRDHHAEGHTDDHDRNKGSRTIELTAAFDPPLIADAGVEVQLMDGQRQLADAEQTTLDAFSGEVNLSPGTEGGDLYIESFTPDRLVIRFSPANTWKTLGSTYTINATLWSGGVARTLDSGRVTVNGDQPPAIGDHYGPFTISAMTPPGDAQSRDSAAEQDEGDQRRYLEDMLNRKGWTYTIVNDVDDFARELRSGAYTVYAILTEHRKLGETIEKELREVVYRGQGLLVAGGRDTPSHGLARVLGVKPDGKRAYANGITLTDSPLASDGQENFVARNGVPGIRLKGASAAARYLWGDPREDGGGATADQSVGGDEGENEDISGRDSDDEDGYHRTLPSDTSVTYYNYGEGRSVFAGFDLLAQAAAVGRGSTFEALLASALKWIHPATLANPSGSVRSLVLNLENRGVAVSGRAVIVLPPGMTVYDPGPTAGAGDGHLTWPFDLNMDGSDQLLLWVRLPDGAGDDHVMVQVQTGTAPDFTDYTTLDLAAPVQSVPSLSAAIAQAWSGGVIFRGVLHHLMQANRELTEGDYRHALIVLLAVTDDLDKRAGSIAHDIRIITDYTIANVERQELQAAQSAGKQ